MFLQGTLSVEITDAGLYRLQQPLIYQGKRDRIEVPAGYITDLASVPRFATAVVPIAGVHDRAAIVHDVLCDRLHTAHAAGEIPAVDSVDTDGLFRRMLRELGVPLAQRWLYWLGVRWGALASPGRRAGWWRTAHLVILLTVLIAPLLLPALLISLVTLFILGALELVGGTLAGPPRPREFRTFQLAARRLAVGPDVDPDADDVLVDGTIDQLRRMREDATEGPWTYADDLLSRSGGHMLSANVVADSAWDVARCSHGGLDAPTDEQEEQAQANAAYIAAVHNALPALLDAAELGEQHRAAYALLNDAITTYMLEGAGGGAVSRAQREATILVRAGS